MGSRAAERHRRGGERLRQTAWNVLCNRVRDEEVDLIVIGSPWYGAIDCLLGTTAARVVNHAIARCWSFSHRVDDGRRTVRAVTDTGVQNLRV
jgi:hypothetical protein